MSQTDELPSRCSTNFVANVSIINVALLLFYGFVILFFCVSFSIICIKNFICKFLFL